MSESLNLSVDLPVSPERVYRAWFDAYEYSQITGKAAQIDAQVGGSFTVWDGAATGINQVMTPFSHIVQSWRGTDFPPGSPDSSVDIVLQPTCLGAQLTLEQMNIPDGQAKKWMDAWVDTALRPLRRYFDALVGDDRVDMDG